MGREVRERSRWHFNFTSFHENLGGPQTAASLVLELILEPVVIV